MKQDQSVGNKRKQEVRPDTIPAATTAMTAKDGTHAGKNSHNQDAQDEQKAHTPLTDEEAAGEEVEQDAPNAFLDEELVTDEQHTKEGIRHSKIPRRHEEQRATLSRSTLD